jgi:hypothetical protein
VPLGESGPTWPEPSDNRNKIEPPMTWPTSSHKVQVQVSGSGMFYIRGRPSTAIGCGTSAIAF